MASAEYVATYYDLNGDEANTQANPYPGARHALTWLKQETYDEGGMFRYYPAVKIEGGRTTLYYLREDRFTDDGKPCDEMRRVSKAAFEATLGSWYRRWLAEAERVNEYEMWGPRGRPCARRHGVL